MNMKVATTVAVMACAMESTVATFLLTTAAATGTTSVLSLGVGTTTLTAGTAGALALTGGLVLLKGLALAALVASRSRRAAVAVDETDAAFSVLAAQEPAQCYRRLICILATGSFEMSENDFIVSLFNKDTSIDSAKFEFATAAKLGKQLKSVQKCELRYSCPLSGEQIQKLF